MTWALDLARGQEARGMTKLPRVICRVCRRLFHEPCATLQWHANAHGRAVCPNCRGRLGMNLNTVGAYLGRTLSRMGALVLFAFFGGMAAGTAFLVLGMIAVACLSLFGVHGPLFGDDYKVFWAVVYVG